MQTIIATLNSLVDQISKDPRVECLMGLGSVSETSRMDQYSDLDFFLIVEKGYKQAFIDDLFWIAPLGIAYQFKNTPDGYKILLSNGVFMEFAVFELSELDHIAYHNYRLVYAKPGFDSSLIPVKLLSPETTNIDYVLNEALTNLLIGLKRNARGETLTAYLFIQNYALRHVINVIASKKGDNGVLIDPFGSERRFEKRFPNVKYFLEHAIQGYRHNIQSAKTILNYIQSIYPVNETLVKEISSYFTSSKMGSPLIETKRLWLRTVEQKDINDFFEMMNDPDIMKYNVMEPKTLHEIEHIVRDAIQDPDTYVLEHKETHQIIGAVFSETDHLRYGVNSINIAYYLKTPWTKQGYMGEALRAQLNELFNVRGIALVTARVFAPNVDSNKLLERLGFTYEGTIKDAILGSGNIVYDDNLYVLRKDDFVNQVE